MRQANSSWRKRLAKRTWTSSRMILTVVHCSQKLGCLSDLVINIELEKRKELRNKMQESLELQPELEKKTARQNKSDMSIQLITTLTTSVDCLLICPPRLPPICPLFAK